MNPFLNQFVEFTRTNNLIHPGERVLLTVSGGIDSSVMTQLFSKTEIDFGIAHCNFQLRGNESDDDEEFVYRLAEKYEKPFYVKRFDTTEFAEENKFSIQQAARKLRYQWFHELAGEFTYHKIATAHHLDDSIETFFINLSRRSGPAGLKGIALQNGIVVRPLLFARRTEIETYANENKIDHREDSSNATDDYLRNRIRHHVIPAITQNIEGFDDNIISLMDDFRFIHSLINDRIAEWKKKFVSEDNDGNYKISLDAVLKEEFPPSFLSTLLYSFGIIGVDCNKIIAASQPGKLFYSNEYTILFDRKFLVLQKTHSTEEKVFSISSLPAEIELGNRKLTIQIGRNETGNLSTIDKNIQQLDAGNISLPLTLRPWKAGDSFIPLGMKGKKKVSDFYTDKKLNRFEKDKTYLLLSGNDIVCILGHHIDERYKITPVTTDVLTIALSVT